MEMADPQSSAPVRRFFRQPPRAEARDVCRQTHGHRTPPHASLGQRRGREPRPPRTVPGERRRERGIILAHKKDGQVTSGTKIKLSRIEPDEEAVKDLTDPEAEAARGGLDLTLGTTLGATHAC